MHSGPFREFLLGQSERETPTPYILGEYSDKVAVLWRNGHMPNVRRCTLWFYIL